MWYPLLLAVLFESFSVVIALVLPETLPITDTIPGDGLYTASVEPTTEEEPDGIVEPGKNWKFWLLQTKNSFGFITRDRTIPALVFTFLISKVGRQANNVLFQYVSKRYGWTLSQVRFSCPTSPRPHMFIMTTSLIQSKHIGRPPLIITSCRKHRPFHRHTTFDHNLCICEYKRGR